MAGTAPDFCKFLEMLRSGGGASSSRETVAAAMRNQIGAVPRREKDAGKRFGFFGAVLDDPAGGEDSGRAARSTGAASMATTGSSIRRTGSRSR